jgi:glycerol uptake facilitator-like aquaporin
MVRGICRHVWAVADDLRMYAVGLYITSAYWLTASSSFANPAVTIARALSDTFAGVAPSGVVAFIAAQLFGMLAAVATGAWLWPKSGKETVRAGVA